MTDLGAAGANASSGAVFDYQKLVNAAVWIFVLSGAISLVEPSPYDFASLIAMPLWFLGGFTLHRSFLLFAFLIVTYTILGFLALIPYWSVADSAMYQYQSAYLTLTALFFALFVGNRTLERAELILSGFTGGVLIAAICGLLGYFDIAGLGEIFSKWGRVSGTFKDPNVLGSYLILGVLYLSQNLMFARARHVVATAIMLAIIVATDFLSFSRGSWGATMVSMALMASAAYATTSDARLKRRIAVSALVAIAIGALVVLVLLSMESTRELFLQRASVTQDYDEGSTGRFGNQLRSLPMLVDHFWGFGPLRFRTIFDLEPHNSYIGAFANAGWLGGFTFILIVGVTVFIGFRLMFRTSPFQRQAQIFFPVLLAFFMQAFQIDIDHWRHVLMLLGVVWGLEAARQKWEARQTLKVTQTLSR
ncbi:MAG: O-antigen ligase family protein [Methylocystis sp.]